MNLQLQLYMKLSQTFNINNELIIYYNCGVFSKRFYQAWFEAIGPIAAAYAN